jgi:hypothetical protein
VRGQVGPSHTRWARPRLGRAPCVGGGVAAPPGVSQVPLCPIFDIKIYKEFFGIFRETLFSRIFQKLAYR